MLRALCAAVMLVPLTAAAKPCPVPSWKPVVARATSTANDHGFLVLAQSDFREGTRAGDPAIHPDWKLDGATPTVDTLAPGLAVYRIPPRATGRVKLTDHKNTVVAEATVGHRAPPPKPSAKNIIRATNAGRRTSTTITVAVDAVPSDVVALVVATPTGVPLTWGRAAPNVVVYASGSCAGTMPGTIAPAVGDKVTLHWVDEAGRLSAASDPLVVRAP